MQAALQATLLLAAPAAFAADRDLEACARNDEGDQELRISGCSRVIARGTAESTDRRAYAYLSRGNAREIKGDHDGALADYDAATRLAPK